MKDLSFWIKLQTSLFSSEESVTFIELLRNKIEVSNFMHLK